MPNSKKILIIDDDLFLSDIYSLQLRKAGFNVTAAGSGDLGLSEMQKEKPDLILLDIVMPGKSGIETLKKIRETDEYKDLKILLLTNMRDEETIKTIAKETGWECEIIFDDGEDQYLVRLS